MNGEEMFSQEPRDPKWAEKVERWLAEGLQKDLLHMTGTHSDLAVECRTTVCKVSWKVPDDPSEAQHLQGLVRAAIRTLYPPARTSATRGAVYAFYVGGDIYGDSSRDPDVLVERVTGMRAKLLAQSRRHVGDTGLIHFVPADKWPEQ